MTGTRQLAGFVCAWIMLAASSFAQAGDHCCRCGTCSNLKKVCRAVPAVKEVVEVCWSCKCEDVCVPGCSEPCGVVRECDECGPWCRTIWKPGCAKIYTRRIPVKKEVVRKIPTVRWEVETVCASCCLANADTYRELTVGEKLVAKLNFLTIGPRKSAEEEKNSVAGGPDARIASLPPAMAVPAYDSTAQPAGYAEAPPTGGLPAAYPGVTPAGTVR